jgi:hypothetical protein
LSLKKKIEFCWDLFEDIAVSFNYKNKYKKRKQVFCKDKSTYNLIENIDEENEIMLRKDNIVREKNDENVESVTSDEKEELISLSRLVQTNNLNNVVTLSALQTSSSNLISMKPISFPLKFNSSSISNLSTWVVKNVKLELPKSSVRVFLDIFNNPLRNGFILLSPFLLYFFCKELFYLNLQNCY